MSLISEINRTETEKNKTKQVATNIDNKLVELGGEQAINLADVPNQMDIMVKGNYKKIAFGNIGIINEERSSIDFNFNCSFPIKTLIAFVKVKTNSSGINPNWNELARQVLVWGYGTPEQAKTEQSLVFSNYKKGFYQNDSWSDFGKVNFEINNINTNTAQISAVRIDTRKAEADINWLEYIAIG